MRLKDSHEESLVKTAHRSRRCHDLSLPLSIISADNAEAIGTRADRGTPLNFSFFIFSDISSFSRFARNIRDTRHSSRNRARETRFASVLPTSTSRIEKFHGFPGLQVQRTILTLYTPGLCVCVCVVSKKYVRISKMSLLGSEPNAARQKGFDKINKFA